MDIETLILIGGAIWAMLGWLTDRARTAQHEGESASEGASGRAPVPAPPRTGRRPPRTRTSRGRSRTAQDAQLETLRRELERQLGIRTETPGRGPLGRRSGTPLESAEEVEERDSLEEEPVVVSMEVDGDRGVREVVDHDAEAEQLVAARIARGAARSGAWTAADHRRFDARIRASEAQEPVARTEGVRTARLRRAVIWREILGPPKALTD